MKIEDFLQYLCSRLRLGSPPKGPDAINLGFDSCQMYNVENWTDIYMVRWKSSVG